jgi:hypothetical protein
VIEEKSISFCWPFLKIRTSGGLTRLQETRVDSLLFQDLIFLQKKKKKKERNDGTVAAAL